MNVKRFKRSFSVASFYIQLYIKQKVWVGKFELFFRVGQVTVNRGTFCWPYSQKTFNCSKPTTDALEKDVSMFQVNNKDTRTTSFMSF